MMEILFLLSQFFAISYCLSRRVLYLQRSFFVDILHGMNFMVCND